MQPLSTPPSTPELVPVYQKLVEWQANPRDPLTALYIDQALLHLLEHYVVAFSLENKEELNTLLLAVVDTFRTHPAARAAASELAATVQLCLYQCGLAEQWQTPEYQHRLAYTLLTGRNAMAEKHDAIWFTGTNILKNWVKTQQTRSRHGRAVHPAWRQVSTAWSQIRQAWHMVRDTPQDEMPYQEAAELLFGPTWTLLYASDLDNPDTLAEAILVGNPPFVWDKPSQPIHASVTELPADFC